LATDLAVREFLTEGLFAKALEVPSVAREINLQIVFEGTVRVFAPTSRSTRTDGIEVWSKCWEADSTPEGSWNVFSES
jgi:hypothetical protein